MRIGFGRVIPLLALLLAASCGPGKNEFAPVCPVPYIPKQIGDLARYKSATQEPRDLIVRAHIFDIPGKCAPGDKGKVVATMTVALDVARGPALEGRSYTLPLFLAITDTGAITDEVDIPLIVTFPSGQDSVRVQTPPKEIELPVTVQKTAASFGLVAGFRLTPEEVAAVRRVRPK